MLKGDETASMERTYSSSGSGLGSGHVQETTGLMQFNSWACMHGQEQAGVVPFFSAHAHWLNHVLVFNVLIGCLSLAHIYSLSVPAHEVKHCFLAWIDIYEVN